MKPRSLRLVALAVTFIAFGPQAFAERADKTKAAVIIADRSSGDDLNQTQLFTGDVVLTKGTIILRADQLTTRQDPEGYNYGTAIATKPGKLAYFKQKREGVDEYIEGQAERIDYDEKTDTVKLCNRAVVKRLVAGRDADESRGDCIDYNSRTEVYHNESNVSTATSGGRRTTTILQPKIRPGEAAADTPAARSLTSPSIELRKEPTIEQKVP
jgi:lipopolysaccharide export system protein LptA